MQMKYLSLALAAALATTLTACGGSDNKSNYNKDTLTPVSPGTTTPDKEDPKGDKEDPKGDKEDPKGDKEDPKDPEKEDKEDKKEEPGENVPNPEDNPGNAAESGDKAKKPSVVGQQYIRGVSSGFDTTNNKEYDANATVISYVPLQNKQMTNIVVAEYDDVSRQKSDGTSETTKYLLGEEPEINPNPQDVNSIQAHNDASVQYDDGAATISGKLINQFIGLSSQDLADLKAKADTPADVKTAIDTYTTAMYTGGSKLYSDAAEYDKQSRDARIAKYASVVELSLENSNAPDLWRAGIVGVAGNQSQNNAATFVVGGQENNIVTWKDGVAIEVDDKYAGSAYVPQNYDNGQNPESHKDDARVFGANSQYLGDKSHKTGDNDSVQAFFNSYIAPATPITGSPTLVDTFVNANTQFNNNAIGVVDADVGKMEVILKNQITPTRLENVQYGRVTGSLTGVTAEQIKGKEYIRANFAGKFDYSKNDVKAVADKADTATDVYFYRGLNETALDKMPKEGKYNYLGHALMYGIDNTFAGVGEKGLSNSVAFGGDSRAVGNFVQAQYDAGAKTVQGSVYNLWYKQPNNKDLKPTDNYKLERIDLVAFNGKVVGNSIEGTADRTYISGDDKAAYKGSFYGANASEMGGSFNSVTEGYADSKWGGVFGAKRLDKANFVPVINRVD